MGLKSVLVLPALLCMLWVSKTDAHGRLLQPTSRSTLWRLFPNEGLPINYNDHELFCGGFSKQVANGYKCGLCGDNYNDTQPRANENGGTYGKGRIKTTYQQGQVIEVIVQITAHHKGWFEFKICPLDLTQSNPISSEACFDQNLLLLPGGQDKYMLPNTGTRNYAVKLKLPTNLVCDQCVLRWRYHAGNSWGICEDGFGAVGCGLQEEFYGCADVTINATDVGDAPTGTPSSVTESRNGNDQTTMPSDSVTFEHVMTTASIEGESNEEWRPIDNSLANTFLKKGYEVKCKADKIYHGNTAIDDWCTTVCFHKPAFCPTSHCRCSVNHKCVGFVPLPLYAGDDNVKLLCQYTCRNGGNDCADFCRCSADADDVKVCVGTGKMANVNEFAKICNMMCNVKDEWCPTDCLCEEV